MVEVGMEVFYGSFAPNNVSVQPMLSLNLQKIYL